MFVLSAAIAHACQCAPQLVRAEPSDGDEDVPTNALPLAVYVTGITVPALIDAETGEEIPTTSESVYGTPRRVPGVPLQADHTYVLDDPYYGFPELPATFRTGGGPDDIAPGRDEIVAVAGSHNPDAACQESLYLTPEIVPADEEPWLTHAVQIATGPDFADATTVPAPLALGRGFCTTTVPWLEPGQEVWLRSRAVDLAGNAGPWSSPYHVEAVPSDVEPTPPADDATGVPSADRGCGCSAGPGPSALPLVLALVLGRGRSAPVGRRGTTACDRDRDADMHRPEEGRCASASRLWASRACSPPRATHIRTATRRGLPTC